MRHLTSVPIGVTVVGRPPPHPPYSSTYSSHPQNLRERVCVLKVEWGWTPLQTRLLVPRLDNPGKASEAGAEHTPGLRQPFSQLTSAEDLSSRDITHTRPLKLNIQKLKFIGYTAKCNVPAVWLLLKVSIRAPPPHRRISRAVGGEEEAWSGCRCVALASSINNDIFLLGGYLSH